MNDTLLAAGRRVPFRGSPRLPPDKSLLQRGIVFSCLARGWSRLRGLSLPLAGDPASTLRAVQRLFSLRICRIPGEIRILSPGAAGLRLPDTIVQLDNSATGLRLLAGLASACPGRVCLQGDASLRRRPLRPLRDMLTELGARLQTTRGGAPLRLRGATLMPGRLEIPASAQLQTAALLAALRAGCSLELRESGPCRDHTERLLTAMGVRLKREDSWLRLLSAGVLRPLNLWVPGDTSAATLLAAAALVTPGSDLILQDVGLNPSRLLALEMLRDAGGELDWTVTAESAGEPRGQLRVRYSLPRLRPLCIGAEEFPAVVDDVMALALPMALVPGTSSLAGAAALRGKESDRLAGLVRLFHQLGRPVRETTDGFAVQGGRLRRGLRLDSVADHRLALLQVLLVLRQGGEVSAARCARVSWPGFFALLADCRQSFRWN